MNDALVIAQANFCLNTAPYPLFTAGKMLEIVVQQVHHLYTNTVTLFQPDFFF